MNESELDDKIRALDVLQRYIYAEKLALEVGVIDDYYEGITFSEALKMCFATFEQKLNSYNFVLSQEKKK